MSILWNPVVLLAYSTVVAILGVVWAFQARSNEKKLNELRSRLLQLSMTLKDIQDRREATYNALHARYNGGDFDGVLPARAPADDEHYRD